ncbi:BamA/TamA family outer membrane protein [Sediminitomix flava]|uniref:BamA/TamA family outer membrane protein n=1 Tax=Sediminitomix flava TaxID=379075 RepID=UPI0011B21F2B|nr:BamA/TamA family outer membrane protein [Sediminitomix flava]
MTTKSISQDKKPLQLESGLPADIQKKIKRIESAESITQAENTAQQLLSLLKNEGYLFASLDSIWESNAHYHIQLYTGNKLIWGNIDADSLSTAVLQKSFQKAQYKTARWEELSNWKKSIEDFYASNGAPDTQLQITPKLASAQQVDLQIRVEQGAYYVFDTLKVISNGKLNIKKSFFQKYIGIEKGDEFSTEKMELIQDRLKQLAFLQLEEEPSVSLKNEKAYVELKLKKRKANQLDGMLGLMPSENANGSTDYTLTGHILLDIYNPLMTGKHFKLDWQQPDKSSQQLEVLYEHPVFLKKEKLDLEGFLSFQKNDTIFFNANRGLALHYRVSGKKKIGLFMDWESSQSYLDEREEDETTELLDSDYRWIKLGVQYAYNNLDDPFLPKKGSHLLLKMGLGQKELHSLSEEEKLLVENVNPLQSEMSLQYQSYRKLGKTSILKLAFNSSSLFGDQILQNDLYRIGGLKTLRGFDEQSLWVSSYLISTAEAQFFMQNNSYVFLFNDFAWLHDQAVRKESWLANGFGAGISLQSEIGIFQLVYSLGWQEDVPINLQNAKIHFGYRARF